VPTRLSCFAKTDDMFLFCFFSFNGDFRVKIYNKNSTSNLSLNSPRRRGLGIQGYRPGWGSLKPAIVGLCYRLADFPAVVFGLLAALFGVQTGRTALLRALVHSGFIEVIIFAESSADFNVPRPASGTFAPDSKLASVLAPAISRGNRQVRYVESFIKASLFKMDCCSLSCRIYKIFQKNILEVSCRKVRFCFKIITSKFWVIVYYFLDHSFIVLVPVFVTFFYFQSGQEDITPDYISLF